MRIAIFFLVFIASLSTGVAGFCQGIPGCYPQPLPAMKPCAPNRPAPISRTVQVEVPVPCAPTACGGPMLCPPQPCGQPACAPPSPTQPVQVRVDVVVRPEAPKPCVPQRFCCENPPVFEPFFYHAACMIRSIALAPLGVGESILGHGMPRQPCPPPIAVACPPGVGCPHPGFMNAYPGTAPQRMAPGPPQTPCVQGRRPVTAAPSCMPLRSRTHFPKAPLSQ